MSSLTPPPPSPLPRRVALPRWLDTRLLLGVALVLMSVAGGARLVSSAQRTTPVVAAKRALSAGTTLTAAELIVVHVRLPAAVRGRYPSEPAAIVGKQLSRSLAANELIPATALELQSASVTVVVPLPPDSAPTLAPGQRVSIWLTAPSCPARLLIDDIPVQAVHENRAASFAAAGGQTVVLRIAPELASRVMSALAIEDVQLRGVRVEGAARTGADLPDLTRCEAASR